MGTVYKPTYTKPLPGTAEVTTRKGERIAHWIDSRGRKRKARVTIPDKGKYKGADRIVVEASTYTAKYRDGSGHVVKVTTGCRSKDAAESVLKDLQDRADKVRCGAWTAAEDSVLDHRLTPIEQHIAAYLEHLRNKRGTGGKAKVNRQHWANVNTRLRRITAECGFKRIGDLNRNAMDAWANKADAIGIGARTLNGHLQALCAFGNWCVERGRIAANPFNRPPKRDEKADRRRERRALTEDELRRLLKVARLRPIAEYGRKVVKHADAANRANKRSRRTWSRAPLAFDDLEAATARGRDALRDRPDFIRELERRGRERQLVYKTLTLTGLRKGELTALRVRHAELDGPTPYLVLDAADEKAGRGAEIPLRGDLANDLRKWLADRLDDLRNAARDDGTPLPAKLPPDMPLLDVPSGLIRILDRDLVAAGIARLVTDAEGRTRIDKRDDRGRTVDVHALRHTFGTHLSRGGVAPRTAQQALRHGSIELTMQTYTDPKLLDVVGALDVLPSMPLDDSPHSQRQKASGTDGTLLVPMLVPNAGNNSASGANADNRRELCGAGETPISDAADGSYQELPSADTMKALGLEPRTYGLKGRCSAN
jgi:integrase